MTIYYWLLPAASFAIIYGRFHFDKYRDRQITTFKLLTLRLVNFSSYEAFYPLFFWADMVMIFKQLGGPKPKNLSFIYFNYLLRKKNTIITWWP